MSGVRVGVVGDDAEVAEAVRRAGATVSEDPVDLLVARGTDALRATAPRPRAPVLAVDTEPGVHSVASADLDDALDAVVAGDYETVRHPVLAVDGPQERGYALFDLTLVTAEPARISEFSVHSGGERLAEFRADGVVCATPAGSHGYARAADGPLVAPQTGVVAVVPIAPFAIGTDHWVLPVDDVTLCVERNEAPVELLCDDRRVGLVAPDDPLYVEVVAELATVTVGRGLERD